MLFFDKSKFTKSAFSQITCIINYHTIYNFIMDKSKKIGTIYYLFVMYYIIYMYKGVTVHIENIYLKTFYLMKH